MIYYKLTQLLLPPTTPPPPHQAIRPSQGQFSAEQLVRKSPVA